MKLNHPLEQIYEENCDGSWFPFGIGIDVHKEMLWVCVIRPDYKTNKQHRATGKFSTDPKGLIALRVYLEGTVPLEHRRFLIESTSTYHFPVIWALPGWLPTVINPKLVGSAKRKTDRWDAKTLAHHSMAGTFPCYKMPGFEQLANRALYRRYLKCRGTMRRNVQAVQTRLTMFGVNYLGSITTKRGWGILREIAVGRVPALQVYPEADAEQLAGLCTAINHLPNAVRFANRLQIHEYEAGERQSATLWNALVASISPGPLALALSVPHVGIRAAICYICEVGENPVVRFPTVRGVVAFAGFDPSKRISADNVVSHVPTGGSRFLRRVFLEVAQGAMLGKGPLSTYGQSIRDRFGKKGWFAACNAVGRKVVTYLTVVLNRGTPYIEGEFHAKGEARQLDAIWDDQWEVSGGTDRSDHAGPGDDQLDDGSFATAGGWDCDFSW